VKFDTNIYGISWFVEYHCESIGCPIVPCFEVVDCDTNRKLFHFKPKVHDNSDAYDHPHKVAVAKLIYYYAMTFHQFKMDHLADMNGTEYARTLFENGTDYLVSKLKAGTLNTEGAFLPTKNWHSNASLRNEQYEQKIRHFYGKNESCAGKREVANLALAWGMETYWTQGAFEAVVGVLQAGCTDLVIDVHGYLDSLLENVADLFKELNHLIHEHEHDHGHVHGHGGDRQDDHASDHQHEHDHGHGHGDVEFADHFMVEGSKYLWRALLALEQLNKKAIDAKQNVADIHSCVAMMDNWRPIFDPVRKAVQNRKLDPALQLQSIMRNKTDATHGWCKTPGKIKEALLRLALQGIQCMEDQKSPKASA